MSPPIFVRPSLLPKPQPPPILEPVDLDAWDDGDDWRDEFYSDSEPDILDEPWPFRFKCGDSVWVCASDGNWYYGKVVSQAKCGKMKYSQRRREPDWHDALYWCAEFKMGNCRVRKWFAPLNGEIKPDNKNTEDLLWKAGIMNLDQPSCDLSPSFLD